MWPVLFRNSSSGKMCVCKHTGTVYAIPIKHDVWFLGCIYIGISINDVASPWKYPEKRWSQSIIWSTHWVERFDINNIFVLKPSTALCEGYMWGINVHRSSSSECVGVGHYLYGHVVEPLNGTIHTSRGGWGGGLML